MLDDLWQSLQSAIAQPEAAELAPLWQALETALAPLSKEAQLRVAAEAIAQPKLPKSMLPVLKPFSAP